MKKRIIILGVIAIVLVVIILNHSNIYRTYKLHQIKVDCINNINGIFNNRTSEYIRKEYERYHMPIEELNHYNITKIIDAYIDMANESVNLYLLRKQNGEIEYKKKDYDLTHNSLRGLDYGKDMQTEGDDFTEHISYDIENEDINNFNNGTFKEKLIEKLKTCLDYVDTDGKIEWQINSIEDKIIELPYNCYIDYTAYHRENNKEFKKAVDVIFDKNFKLEENVNKVKVKYEISNGNIKENEVFLFYVNRDNKTYYEISLSQLLLIKTDTNAKVKFGSHTFDRMKEEEDWRIFEEWSRIEINYYD